MTPVPLFLVGVDVGGTFTDLVLLDEATGGVRAAKVPTTVAPTPSEPPPPLVARQLIRP